LRLPQKKTQYLVSGEAVEAGVVLVPYAVTEVWARPLVLAEGKEPQAVFCKMGNQSIGKPFQEGLQATVCSSDN
jgi:hypothetical protein